MKVAVTGKGGVGKTTVAAYLARCWRDLGCNVVAVDADPDTNLAGTLGYRGAEIIPLVELRSLVEERVGGADGWSGFLRMNPKVDDIPQQFGVVIDGIRLLVMGTIDRGRRGCACPENVLLREVLNHLVISAGEHVVVDMEAGIEHLGRATAEGVDAMLVVIEPGWASIQTATRIARLARDIGIQRVLPVANKISNEQELAFVQTAGIEAPLLGALPLDRSLEHDARQGSFSRESDFYRAVQGIAGRIPGAISEDFEK
ncbi:MAG: AAA family ATPase [Acidobacteriota bacterium]